MSLRVMRHEPEPGAPPVCERCGKRHGQPFIHDGDCSRCGLRPASGRYGFPPAHWCDACIDAFEDLRKLREITERAEDVLTRIARNRDAR